MTKGMAKEPAPQGIRVNAVSSGTADNYFREKYSSRQLLDGVIAQTSAGKLGTNEEITDCIPFCYPMARGTSWSKPLKSIAECTLSKAIAA